MALPRGTDVEYLGENASGGMCMGSSATELVSFHGAAPTDQCAAISTLTLTTALQSGFGFTTSAGLVNAVAAINQLVDLAKEKGLCA